MSAYNIRRLFELMVKINEGKNVRCIKDVKDGTYKFFYLTPTGGRVEGMVGVVDYGEEITFTLYEFEEVLLVVTMKGEIDHV